MSEQDRRERLRAALQQTGNGWLLDYWGADAHRHLEQAALALDEFADEYERRFHERPDPYQLLLADHPKAQAFFQVDTFLVSPAMRVMIWRLLMGCEVDRIDFHYRTGETPLLEVVLKTPYGEVEAYQGSRPADFRVLRHFGTTTINGVLAVQGYYALR